MSKPSTVTSQAVLRVGIRTPNFRRLAYSWMLSLCGDGIRLLALPLYVAVESRSPLAAAAVAASEALPWLLSALPAGALVDRLPPRTVLIASHAFRAGTSALLAALVTAGMSSVALLCVFAFLLTTAETFGDPASQVMMVHLAGPDELEAANSRFYASSTIALTLIGPMAAGVVFAIGPAWVFTVVSVAFSLAALFAATLPAFTVQASDGVQLVSGIADSARMLFGHRGLRTLLSMSMICSIASSVFNTLLPLYAVSELKLTSHTIGLLVMVSGAACLTGTWIAPRLAARVSDGPVLVSGMGLIGTSFILLGLYPFIPVLIVGIVVSGLGVGLWNVLSSTRRQRLTPAGAMGRVSGVYRMVAWGLMPVGSALAGVTAAATTLRTPLLAAGVITIAGLGVLAVPLLRSGAPSAARTVQVPSGM
ncbi:MFS transporter (plasmid) [Streptomyces sp. AHU1]|uniref:MFS transporter n=1 Tax=Streptomyces sp. AHU1 TaxID=3377215 RepID=UPI0038784496